MHVCMHLEARSQPSAVQVELSNLFLRQGFSLGWILPTRLASVPPGSLLSSPHTPNSPRAGITSKYHYSWVAELSGRHVCKASTIWAIYSAIVSFFFFLPPTEIAPCRNGIIKWTVSYRLARIGLLKHLDMRERTAHLCPRVTWGAICRALQLGLSSLKETKLLKKP